MTDNNAPTHQHDSIGDGSHVWVDSELIYVPSHKGVGYQSIGPLVIICSSDCHHSGTRSSVLKLLSNIGRLRREMMER